MGIANEYKPGMKLKHVAYNGDIVTILQELADGRFEIQRTHRRSKVSAKTLDAEYSLDLDAPVRAHD